MTRGRAPTARQRRPRDPPASPRAQLVQRVTLGGLERQRIHRAVDVAEATSGAHHLGPCVSVQGHLLAKEGRQDSPKAPPAAKAPRGPDPLCVRPRSQCPHTSSRCCPSYTWERGSERGRDPPKATQQTGTELGLEPQSSTCQVTQSHSLLTPHRLERLYWRLERCRSFAHSFTHSTKQANIPAFLGRRKKP